MHVGLCILPGVIQGAFVQEDDGLGPIVLVRKREKNIEHGLASVIGYLSTLAAWVGGDLAAPEVDISLVLRWLYGAGLDYLDEKERDFSKLVQQKKKLYGAEVQAS